MGDEVRAVEGTPVFGGGLDELEDYAQTGDAANNTPDGLWQGDVIVGEDGMSTPITLTPPNDQAPYYRRTPPSLGGGFVGLAPFHLYETACTPPDNEIAFGQGVLETAFNPTANTPVLIQHYGPIKKVIAGPWSSCVRVECRPTITADPCAWFQLTGAFVVHGPGDMGWPYKNAIGLSRATTVFPKAGIYRIILLPNKIRCGDEVTGNPSVVWPLSCEGTDVEQPAYLFRIAPDCDNDGHNDETTPPNLSLCPRTCRVDVNHDGTISVADIFDFLTLWFASDPAADFNGVNGITVQDIFEFLAAWFNSGGLNCS